MFAPRVLASTDDLMKLFHTVDKDGSGCIKLSELQSEFKTKGLHTPDVEVKNHLLLFQMNWALNF